MEEIYLGGYTYSWIFIYGGDIFRRDTHIVGYLYMEEIYLGGIHI